jgi:hypothetical protein
VDVESIIRAVPNRVKETVKERFEYGGLLPPKSFQHVVDALQGLSAESRPILEKFGRSRRELIAKIPTRVKEALAYQKEAIATALSLANIERDELQEWDPPSDSKLPKSFLDGLGEVRVREDSMIANDMQIVPGFEFVRAHQAGAAIFQNEETRLTVVLANRQPLEKQYGVDLIYCNERYKAFVFVQYKAMEKRGKVNYFPLPNDDLVKEVKRMEALLVNLRACPPNSTREGYRLQENPFYLKFCSRIVFNPDDVRLTPGMYIPLDYWKLIDADKRLVGPKGGRQITFENVGRHFENTEFVSLVAKAWIGTTIPQSRKLEAYIREVLQTGRTLAVAVKTDKEDPPPTPSSIYEYEDGFSLNQARTQKRARIFRT